MESNFNVLVPRCTDGSACRNLDVREGRRIFIKTRRRLQDIVLHCCQNKHNLRVSSCFLLSPFGYTLSTKSKWNSSANQCNGSWTDAWQGNCILHASLWLVCSNLQTRQRLYYLWNGAPCTRECVHVVSLRKAQRCHGNTGQSVSPEGGWGAALSATWGFLRFGSDSLAGFSLISLHTCPPPSPCIRPFYLFPSLYSLEFPERHSFFFLQVLLWQTVSLHTFENVVSCTIEFADKTTAHFLHCAGFYVTAISRHWAEPSCTCASPYRTDSTPDSYTHGYKELSRCTLNMATRTCSWADTFLLFALK